MRSCGLRVVSEKTGRFVDKAAAPKIAPTEKLTKRDAQTQPTPATSEQTAQFCCETNVQAARGAGGVNAFYCFLRDLFKVPPAGRCQEGKVDN